MGEMVGGKGRKSDSKGIRQEIHTQPKLKPPNPKTNGRTSAAAWKLLTRPTNKTERNRAARLRFAAVSSRPVGVELSLSYISPVEINAIEGQLKKTSAYRKRSKWRDRRRQWPRSTSKWRRAERPGVRVAAAPCHRDAAVWGLGTEETRVRVDGSDK